jgi:hypothetical protein
VGVRGGQAAGRTVQGQAVVWCGVATRN